MTGATNETGPPAAEQRLVAALKCLLAAVEAPQPEWFRQQGLAVMAARYGGQLSLPEAVQRACRDLAAGWTAQRLMLAQEWTQVLEALAEFRVVVLKGAVAARRLYPHPELRVLGDFDLLVDPGERQAVTQRFESMGYAAGLSQGPGVFSQQAFSRGISGRLACHIDLHWALSNRPLLAQAFDFESLWARSCQVDEFRALAVEQDFCHGCVHLLGHHREAPAAKWLLDLHLAWSGAAPALQASMVDCAIEHQVAPLVDQALDTIRTTCGTAVDPDLQQRLDRYSSQPSSRLLGQGSDAWQDLVTAPGGARGKLRHLLALMVPPADYMRARYGSGSLPKLYLRRWWNGLQQALRPPA